jgi:beta-lactam-binding protein with PASTA domain
MCGLARRGPLAERAPTGHYERVASRRSGGALAIVLASIAIAIAVVALAVALTHKATTKAVSPSPRSTTASSVPVVTMPDLAGVQAAHAVNELHAAGLVAVLRRAHSVNFVSGQIIAQTPTAGAKLRRGSTVTVLVAA